MQSADTEKRSQPVDYRATYRDEKSAKYRETAREVIEIEAEALTRLAGRIDDEFARACDLIISAKGRVVILGMGKSGHIGRKIAATLASTGTPAFFVHPAEASHGDLGMIAPRDVVIAISNSGETEEVVGIVPSLKRKGVNLIAFTGNPSSQLAQAADVHLDVGVDREACTLNLAPTASTTATLAMGDALAIALLDGRGFTATDFAHSHPGGTLGRRLLLYISDIMHTGEAVPVCEPGTPVADALVIMTTNALGLVIVTGPANQVLGVFTDGDLRRVLERRGNVHELAIEEVMTVDCLTVRPGQLATEALNLMEQHKVLGLPVVDDSNRLAGALNMHDLLRAGVY